MTIMNELDQLTDALEKLIFLKDELRTIGKLIVQLQNGTCMADQLKNKILESRVRILKDITEFSKFYISHMLSNETNITPNQQTLKELEQKNLLLIEIAKKLHNMTYNIEIKERSSELFNRNSHIKIELHKHIEALQIEEMLDLIKVKDDKIDINYYKLILWFSSTLEEYYNEKYKKDKEIDMPSKIKRLELPLFLEQRLLTLNKIRNKVSHYKYELTSQDQDETLTSFFMFIAYLITKDFTYDREESHELKLILKTYLTRRFTQIQEFCHIIYTSLDDFFSILT